MLPFVPDVIVPMQLRFNGNNAVLPVPWGSLSNPPPTGRLENDRVEVPW